MENNELTINVFGIEKEISGVAKSTGKPYSLIPLSATDENGKKITVKLSGWEMSKAEQLKGKQVLIFNAYSKENQWGKLEYSVGTKNTYKVLGEAKGEMPAKTGQAFFSKFNQGAKQNNRGKVSMNKLVEATKFFLGQVGGFFPNEQAKAQIVGDLVRTAAACGALDEQTVEQALKETKTGVVEASKQARKQTPEERLASIMENENIDE